MLKYVMRLETDEIHIWSFKLALSSDQMQEKLALLSPDELVRANRFIYPIHRERFIAARSAMREILALYLHLLPQNIIFDYSEHKKPSLAQPNPSSLKFNLAHSDETGIIAITLHHEIGVDIEKIQEPCKEDVAKRFFSHEENDALDLLSNNEKTNGFYKLWSRKEAILKATGKGLTTPLSSFSVPLNDQTATIHLENETWSLIPFTIDPHYQSALASNQHVKKITFWEFFNHGYGLNKLVNHCA